MILNTDLSREYDKYYKGGEKSLYNKKFSKIKIPSHNYWLIHKKIKEIVKSNKLRQLKILDFGCGDGRTHDIFEKAVQKMNKRKNFNLEILAYDISRIGLFEYYKRIKKDFKVVKSFDKKLQEGEVATLKGEFIKIRFILGKVKNQTSFLLKKIKDVDVTVSMYDVLCHIQSKQKRIKLYEALNKITKYSLILEVSTIKVFKHEQMIYSGLRKQECIVGVASEEGDIYYVRYQDNRVKVKNFFHVFKIDEIKYELEMSGVQKHKVIISQIKDISVEKMNWLKYKIDEYLAKILTILLPYKILNKVATEICVIIDKY